MDIINEQIISRLGIDENVIEKQIESELGIDENVINKVFHCIVKGSIEDVREKRNLFPSITYNSKYNDIWDCINAKCAESFCDGYTVTMHKRGIYEFITILNLSSDCIYLLMKEKNFSKLISGSMSNTHYMKCLTLINNDLEVYPQVYGQMRLDIPENDEIKSKKEFIKNTIIGKLNTSVKRFVVITFEPDIYTGIKEVYVNVVASDTSTKYRKNWTSAIKSTVIPQDDVVAYNSINLDVIPDNVAAFDIPAEVKIKNHVKKTEI